MWKVNLGSDLFMKNMFLLVVGLVALMLIGTGCGTPGSGRFVMWNPGYISPLDPISQSSIPADPIRRSETFIQNLDGSYNYSHSQGTVNSAYRSWGPYGPEENLNQSTYNNTYESYTPAPRYYPPMVGASVVIPGTQQGTKPCPQGTIVMRPNPAYRK